MGDLTAIGSLIEYLSRQLTQSARRIRSRHWPATSATIFRSCQPKGKCGCKLVIVRYRFFVSGEKYCAIHNEPFFIDLPGSFMRQYAAGTEIPIRYNPADPSRSIALI